MIADAVVARLERRRSLEGETVLVTAGGTREAIDPVRFLGNRSSGKMGYALAEAAAERGAKVILVSAPTALERPQGCEFIAVTTAAEMEAAVMEHLPRATMVIAAAAVADYRAAQVADRKIRRNGGLTLTLEPTADIIKRLAEVRVHGTVVIGFAAETEDAVENGRAKLLRKGVDAVVTNDVSLPGLGFDSDRNAAVWLTAEETAHLPESTKRELAERILDEAAKLAIRIRVPALV